MSSPHSVSFLLLLALFCWQFSVGVSSGLMNESDWLIRHPYSFEKPSFQLKPIDDIARFDAAIKAQYDIIYKAHDGESVDYMEHYFYGLEHGVAIELGAVGGTAASLSQTAVLDQFNWGRILIEANPHHRQSLQTLHNSFTVSAAICENPSELHFVTNKYVSGIVEFMSEKFIKSFFSEIHKRLYGDSGMDAPTAAGTGRLSLNYASIDSVPNVHIIQCLPLSTVLRRAHVDHVNLFILDVEGGELEVLRTVDWNTSRFDVIVVETETAFRPSGYFEQVNNFLTSRGYICDHPSLGRNSWFRHRDFTPSVMPNLKNQQCFRGAEKHMQKNLTIC